VLINKVFTSLNACSAKVKLSAKAIEKSLSTGPPHVKAYVIAGTRSTERDDCDPPNVQPGSTRGERARDQKQRLSRQGYTGPLREKANKHSRVPIVDKDMSKLVKRNEVHDLSDADSRSGAHTLGRESRQRSSE
jgi:hypothetical protein